MAQTAKEVEQQREYWRPAIAEEHPQEERPVRPSPSACPECGSDLAAGAHFCPMCGVERDGRRAHRASVGGAVARWFDMERVKADLGLPTGSLVALFLGLACLVAAVATGFLFSAATMADWEALQAWRLEWLLAAIAAMLVGLVLKK